MSSLRQTMSSYRNQMKNIIKKDNINNNDNNDTFIMNLWLKTKFKLCMIYIVICINVYCWVSILKVRYFGLVTKYIISFILVYSPLSLYHFSLWIQIFVCQSFQPDMALQDWHFYVHWMWSASWNLRKWKQPKAVTNCSEWLRCLYCCHCHRQHRCCCCCYLIFFYHILDKYRVYFYILFYWPNNDFRTPFFWIQIQILRNVMPMRSERRTT